MHIAKRFGAFLFVGSIGFLVDVSVLYVFTLFVGFDSYTARLFSFAIAVTTTWILNRLITFSDLRTGNLFREWSQFVLANSFGFGINFVIYSTAVFLLPASPLELLVALALGSIAGLATNFLLTHLYVYRKDNSTDTSTERPLH